MQTRDRVPQSNAELQLIARLKSCQKIVVDFSEDKFRAFHQALEERLADMASDGASGADVEEITDLRARLAELMAMRQQAAELMRLWSIEIANGHEQDGGHSGSDNERKR